MAKESTETVLRSQVKALIKMGLAQRVIAERLDVHPSWISRWLRGQTRPMSVHEMDRFRAYVAEFQRVLAEMTGTESQGGPQRPPAAEGFRDRVERPKRRGRP